MPRSTLTATVTSSLRTSRRPQQRNATSTPGGIGKSPIGIKGLDELIGGGVSEELARNIASLGFDRPRLVARAKPRIDRVQAERSEIEETTLPNELVVRAEPRGLFRGVEGERRDNNHHAERAMARSRHQ